MFHRLHHLRRRLFKIAKVEALGSPVDEDIHMALPPVPQDITDDEILQALEKVSPEFREVVLMADVEDFSYKEIAETLNIPLGTVMSRLSRGRRLLREGLAGIARTYGIRPGSERGGESA
jgi:RNA polymerase sigma-70 factor (ECF subfamily)